LVGVLGDWMWSHQVDRIVLNDVEQQCLEEHFLRRAGQDEYGGGNLQEALARRRLVCAMRLSQARFVAAREVGFLFFVK